jgi:hypothetical protein
MATIRLGMVVMEVTDIKSSVDNRGTVASSKNSNMASSRDSSMASSTASSTAITGIPDNKGNINITAMDKTNNMAMDPTFSMANMDRQVTQCSTNRTSSTNSMVTDSHTDNRQNPSSWPTTVVRKILPPHR